MFTDWLDLYKKIHVSPVAQILQCPECGHTTVDFQYVGDEAARKGYLDMWCRHCNNGVHLSRVTIPEKAHVIAFDASDNVLTARIPDFKQVAPKELEN